MNRILAIARKEFLHLIRDRRTLATVLIVPLFQLFLFSYALSFDVRNVPTLVVDQDHTPASRNLVQTFEKSGFFQVKLVADTMDAVDPAFERGQVRAAIVVAPGYGDALAASGKGEVAVLVDGSEPNSAQLGQTYATAISRLESVKLSRAAVERLGGSANRAAAIDPRIRLWYNPEAKSSYFLVPGLIVVIIMVVMVQQTATTMVREEDEGTLEQLLVSPLRRYELVVGKVLPWVGVAAADIIFITFVSLTVLGIPFRGDILLFSVASGLFVLCCLSVGLFISSISSSVEVANQVALIFSFLPAFMLSGFVFPLANIPPILQAVSYLFPARYMITISRGVFLKGASWDVLAPELVALAIYAVVALTLSSIAFRRKMA